MKLTSKTVLWICLLALYASALRSYADTHEDAIQKTLDEYSRLQNAPAIETTDVPPTVLARDPQGVSKIAVSLPSESNILSPQFEPEDTDQPVVELLAQPLDREVIPEVVPTVPEALSEDLPDNEMIDVLELKDIEVSDVLKLISQKIGINIIANQNVRGKVTIYLKNVKLKDCLRIVLDANDLAYKVEDGIVRVMPAKEFEDRYGFKFGGKVETQIVRLAYANVNDVTAVLNQVKSQSGKIIADPKSNTLVLMDSSEKLSVMEQMIEQIDVPIETEVFELTYAQAKNVSEKITEVLTKDTGHIKFDDRSNKIIVTDTPLKIKEIEKVIKAFDIKEKQVLIEAKIIQVKLDHESQFGVDWEALVEKAHGLDLASNFDVLPTAGNRGTMSIGTISDDHYTAVLQALESMEDSSILSSPSITALNNQEAKILVGTTQPYVTTTTTTPSSGPTTTAESVNFIDVGVKLYVTPIIHKDNFVTMKIRPEVSSAATSLETSQNNKIPIVDTSQAETTVTIRDGVTIIIGGLIKEEKVKQIKKVPFLGDVPFLGAAFRNTDDHPVKTEIVIFLTPKIISGDVYIDARTVKDVVPQHLFPEGFRRPQEENQDPQ